MVRSTHELNVKLYRQNRTKKKHFERLGIDEFKLLKKISKNRISGLGLEKNWVRTETCRRGSLVNTVMKLLIPLKEGNVQ